MILFGNGDRSNYDDYDLLFAKAKYSIDELSDRFYDIEQKLIVKVNYNGFLREIDAYAPFHGLISVKKIINLLNKDIDVQMSDTDTVKMRNSVIFYNEYFVPSPENKYGSLPAPIAFERIEDKYNKVIGKTEVESHTRCPFINDVLEGIVYENQSEESGEDFNPDNAMKSYIENKKKLDSKIKSSKYFVKQDTTLGLSSNDTSRMTKHAILCKRLPNIVDLDNYEKCFENVEFD